MKKRSQIENRFKWDTTHIYSNEKDLDNDIEFIKNSINKLKSYKGKLNNKKDIFNYFEFCNSVNQVVDKVSSYVYLNHSENLETQKYVELLNILGSIESEMSVATSFQESELLNNDDKFLKELINDSHFINYQLFLKELIRNKIHVLPESEEKIVSQASDFMGGFSEVFDNIDALDVKFEDFKVDNKNYKVNNSTISLLYEHKDPRVREGVFKSLNGGFMKLQNTIATNYISSVKQDKFIANVYKYNSSLEMAINGDNLPEKIYTNLIEQVNNNVKYMHKYLKLRKKALNLKTLKYSDLHVSIVNFSEKYTYDEMCETLYKAVAPLGEKYVAVVKNAINNRWIDVYPTDGKDTGGYCLGVYDTHPYILLNTVNNQESMFTLAHEMGHAMHSYLSNKFQPYQLAHYPIFLAEIASTTNEVLLIKYLYKNAKTNKEKLYLLNKYISMFRTTIFRQTMFAEFEHFAHKKVENNEPISKDILVKEYERLNKVYHGSAIKPCKEINYEWLRIPHFYRSYYVYKYATGLTSAVCIASEILKGNLIDKYLEFLSSGGSDYPHETLKKLGIDLTTATPYDTCFGELKWALNELEKVIGN